MAEGKKACPFCGQEISVGAKKCIHCGKWLDKTIKCPTCGETINESAKICRFCKEPVPHKVDLSKLKNVADLNGLERKSVIVGGSVVGTVVAGLVIFNLIYIPPCNSGSVLNSVTKQLNRGMFDSVKIDYGQPLEKRVLDNGRICKVEANVIGTSSGESYPAFVDYKFVKNGFGLSLDSHFALPDCYNQNAIDTARSAIEDGFADLNLSDTIKEISLDLVEPNGSKNEGTPSEEVYCKAQGTISRKPGWGNDEDSKISVKYTLKHCENHYKWCAESEWRFK